MVADRVAPSRTGEREGVGGGRLNEAHKSVTGMDVYYSYLSLFPRLLSSESMLEEIFTFL